MNKNLIKSVLDNCDDYIFLFLFINTISLYLVSFDMFDFFHSPDYRGLLVRASVIIITHTILGIPILYLEYGFIRILLQRR